MVSRIMLSKYPLEKYSVFKILGVPKEKSSSVHMFYMSKDEPYDWIQHNNTFNFLWECTIKSRSGGIKEPFFFDTSYFIYKLNNRFSVVDTHINLFMFP